MAVRRVTYKMVLDSASAKESAAKAASYYKQAFASVRVGGAAPAGVAGGGGTSGMAAGGMLGTVGKLAIPLMAGYMGTQAIANAGRYALKVAETTEDFTRSQAAFEAIVGSATKAAELQESIKSSSAGTLSNTEALAAAQRLYGMSIARTAEQARDFTKLATAIGSTTGLGTDRAMENLSAAIANQSFMRLDQMYLSASEVRKEVNRLKSDGVEAAEAFSQAVLSIGGKQFQPIIDDLDASVSSTETLSKALADLNLAAGEALGADSALQVGATASTRVINGLIDALGRPGVQDTLHKTGLELQMIAKYGPGGLIVSQVMAGLGVGPEGAFKDMGFGNYEAMRMARLVDRLDPPVEPWIKQPGARGAPAVPFQYWDAAKGEEITADSMIKMLGFNPPREQYDPSAPRDIKAGAAAIKDAGEDFASKVEGMLRGVAGLFGTSGVTSDDVDKATAGLGVNYPDDYLRRLKDEVQNGVDWENVSIEDAASAIGLPAGIAADVILREFEKAWSDSSLFADPENLQFINVAAVQDAMGRQADSAKGVENVKAMFGLGDEGDIEALQAVGIEIYNPLAVGLAKSISSDGGRLGVLLAAQVADGFAEGVGGVDFVGLIVDSTVERTLTAIADSNEEGV